MSDQARPVPRAFRVLQAVLVGITLVTLWLVAWKIRDAKVEARGGGRERIEDPAVPPPAAPVALGRGASLRAGHFQLDYPGPDGALRVSRTGGEQLVEFTELRAGDRRAWQELQIEVLESSPQSHLVRLEFRPGSACRGRGAYRAVKPGLRIEIDNVAFTVSRWDPAAGGAVKFDSGSELPVAPGADTPLPVGSLSVRDGQLLVK